MSPISWNLLELFYFPNISRNHVRFPEFREISSNVETLSLLNVHVLELYFVFWYRIWSVDQFLFSAFVLYIQGVLKEITTYL